MLLEMRMIGADAGIEHRPTHFIPIGAVADIRWSGLNRMGRVEY